MSDFNARFWDKVKILGNDECWDWVAGKFSDGYGQFRLGAKKVRAHRLAYEMVVGSIPGEMFIDHMCHNKSCVNPNHLRLSTPAENTRNQKLSRNNKSGLKGAFKCRGKWRAQIKVNNIITYLGYFNTLEDAHAAYCDAAKRLHGEFANFGEVA